MSSDPILPVFPIELLFYHTINGAEDSLSRTLFSSANVRVNGNTP